MSDTRNLANALSIAVLGHPTPEPPKPPKRKRKATIGYEKGQTSQQHSHRLAEFVKERDAEPISVPTALGVWTSGKGGTGKTTFYTPPVRMPLKKKYRP